MEHTKLPWYTAVWGYEQGNIRAGDRDGTNLTVATCEGRPEGINEANAQFIVKACNAHEELVEACKYALDYVKEELIDGSGLDRVHSILDALASALTKATED